MVYRKKKRWKKEKKERQSRYSIYFEKASGLTQAREEYWDEVISTLQQMKNELVELGDIPAKSKSIPVIRYCLSFLDIISRYQDKLDGGIKICKGKEKAKIVYNFNEDLKYCGRHTKYDHMTSASGNEIPFWNVTSKGEPINEHNIFFGPDIGLKQYSANYWLNLKKSQKIQITVTKNYEKGKLKKQPILMWGTDALVKYSQIYTFCNIGRKRFIEHISLILT